MNPFVHQIRNRESDRTTEVACDERAQFEPEPAKTTSGSDPDSNPDPEAEVVA
ncbi:hypothetical protein [Halopiger aswanensis]|uniref:Uncharacterized protein n=1 Tax=Halopiger aswanensis TaxID=148449 RepID=A0A419WEW8_9EURY|nr:hypothetical protein [Halopiger aswanensis]RKD93993.1 hypothetical protein ATJ93_3628 [Halopiger aswanensis]